MVRGFRTFRSCRRTGQKNRFAKGERAVERKRCSAYYILSLSLRYPHTLTPTTYVFFGLTRTILFGPNDYPHTLLLFENKSCSWVFDFIMK